MAQQQVQLDELWQQKLREELDHRDLKKQLIECFKVANNEERDQILRYLRENKMDITAGGASNQLSDQTDFNIVSTYEISSENNEPEDQQQQAQSDIEFEQELQKFKERLDNISREAEKKRSKLVPNISTSWINYLKQLLVKQGHGYTTPRHSDPRAFLWLNK